MTELTKTECGHWSGAEQRRCRSGENVRQYVIGHRCGQHSPAAIAGKAEPPTGPGWPIFREAS